MDEDAGSERIQLELPVDVLCRLLRERSLVACEFRCLNHASSRAGWRAVKRSVVAVPQSD